LLEFVETAKGAGITCLFINHVTRAGKSLGRKLLNTPWIASFTSVEPSLEAAIYPKNRFGPATLDPIVLIMDEHGLKESPYVTAQASMVLGYSGIGSEFAEAQATVTIPKYGSRAGLSAPSSLQERLSNS